MGNNEKEQVNPDLSVDNSDQELTNNIDGTQAVPESEDLPHDVPNDETPPMSEMPKNYEKLSKKIANVASKD